MLELSDAPYRFFPSKPSRPVIAVSRLHNRLCALRNKSHRITEISIKGATSPLSELAARSDARILFVANHPTHSDSQTLTEVQRRLGIVSSYMAAYDVFLRSKFNAWIMQHNGAFSIDREGSDRKSMSTAIDILAAGTYPLTIFSEGNVHFTNDRVSPLQDGASFIAVRALKNVAGSANVYAVPVALKYTHLTHAAPRVQSSLSQLAAAVGERIDEDGCPVQELMRVGRYVLVHLLSKFGFLTAEEESQLLESGCLFESINRNATRIVTELERKIGIPYNAESSRQERIKRIRSTIRQILSDPGRHHDHDAARAWSAETMLALRILGYGSPYASEKPTLDRYAETVERMNEDFYNRAAAEPFGDRAAIAHIGEPIDLSTVVQAGESKSRSAVSTLTGALESSLQASLDETNSTLSTPGSQPFADSVHRRVTSP